MTEEQITYKQRRLTSLVAELDTEPAHLQSAYEHSWSPGTVSSSITGNIVP